MRGSARWALLAGVALGGVSLAFWASWLAPLPLAVIFALIAGSANARGAARIGYAAGLGFFALHLLWLPLSFGALFGVPGLVTALLPLVLALFWAALAAGTRVVAGRYTLLALPFAWVLLEWARNQGELAFPWGTLGYALLPTPLIQIADLGGVHLVSLLVAAMAAAIAQFGRDARPLGIVALLWLLAAGYGLTRPAAPVARFEVLLTQGALDPLRRASGTQTGELELHANLTREALRAGPASLIIWPEGSVPVAPTDPSVSSALSALGTPAIIGAPTFEGARRFNSAYGFAERITGRFDKLKLVPFGEFFPLRETLTLLYDPIFSSLGLPGLRGTTAGTTLKPLALGQIRAATYICYESAFPEMARTLVSSGANLLVNISNDAWFGAGVGAEQHFQMGRVRAIETRRYLARAGNDGVTAVVDSNGRVVTRLPRFSPGVLRGSVALLGDLTPFVRFGDWIVWLCAAVVALSVGLNVKPRVLL